MSVPTFAYVAFKDGGKAIVAVSLIKKYSSSTVHDTAKNKEVYWRSEAGGDDDVVEDYYRGDVVVLGVSRQDLIQRMAKKNIAVPDSIFDGPASDASGSKSSRKAISRKEKERLVTASRKRRLGELLKDASEGSDEELVEKRRFIESEERCRALSKKVKTMQKRIDELQTRNDKLQDLLTDKIDALLGQSSRYTVPQKKSAPGGTTWERNGVIEDDEPVQDMSGESMPALRRDTCAGEAHILQAATQGEEVEQQAPGEGQVAPEEVPLLAEMDGKVHLGKGIYLQKDKWELLLKKPRDSLFCKDCVKALWSPVELKDRSVTGTACRRFARQEGHQTQHKALSPIKLQAVGNAFEEFIRRTANEVCSKERRRKMNRYVAELLNDYNK